MEGVYLRITYLDVRRETDEDGSCASVKAQSICDTEDWMETPNHDGITYNYSGWRTRVPHVCEETVFASDIHSHLSIGSDRSCFAE